MNYDNQPLATAEIVKQLGYFPAFLLPATDSSSICHSLIQHSLSAYINNPLPTLLKEKLFVYLSRHSNVNYFTICHSCGLHSLGISATDILALVKTKRPQVEQDLSSDLHLLDSNNRHWENWLHNVQVETSLLRCSSLIFLQPFESVKCSVILKQFLGTVIYNYLLVFLGYIKLCHQWLILHPEISHQQDPRSQLYLGSLLLEEIELAQFFQAQNQKENSPQVAPTFTTLPTNNYQAVSTRDSLVPVAAEFTIENAKDVTDFAHHQFLLAETEAKLKLVLKATRTGNWSWNLLNNQIDICHRGRAILGLNDFDGSYQNFWQSILPDEKEFVNLAAIKSITTQKELNLEYRLLKPNNQICWIRVSGKLFYDSYGQGIKLTGLVTDITQEKQNSTELTNINRAQPSNVVQSLQKLEALLNLIPYYLFVVDIQTKSISIMNLGLAKSLGLTNPEAIKGKMITECFAPDYARQILRLHQQVLADQQVLHLQEEVTLPDGIHYFDTVITPLHNDNGGMYAILHTSSDIPNLAATQEALSQRTLQLEAANRELESFSYSVSHDLQAPLRVINGFSQVLWDNYQSSLDDRGRHYLQRIQANSQRMSNLIDALLQLSRVTRSQMQSISVNLSEIAQDIIEELKGAAPERQVKFEIASNLIAQGDPQLLRIVLSNLLDNAWKYTSKRSQAKIEFNVLSDDKSQSIYYVRDNGAGFDLEYAGKLFTAFKRLHSQQDFPGTGIGLATVQRIIYRHGGKVWAEGESDRGATIYFSL